MWANLRSLALGGQRTRQGVWEALDHSCVVVFLTSGIPQQDEGLRGGPTQKGGPEAARTWAPRRREPYPQAMGEAWGPGGREQRAAQLVLGLPALHPTSAEMWTCSLSPTRKVTRGTNCQYLYQIIWEATRKKWIASEVEGKRISQLTWTRPVIWGTNGPT